MSSFVGGCGCSRGRFASLCPISMATFAGGRSQVDEGVVSVPDHALGHMWLGDPHIHAPRRGRHRRMRICAGAGSKLPAPMLIGTGKTLIRSRRRNRGARRRGPAAQLATMAYRWMIIAGVAKLYIGSYEQASRVVSMGDRGQSSVLSHILFWLPPSRSLVAGTMRIPQSRRASRSTRPSPSARCRMPLSDGAKRRPQRIRSNLSAFSRHAEGRRPNNDRRLAVILAAGDGASVAFKA